MAGRKPDYRVMFVEDNGKGRKVWYKIGSAWKNGESNSVGVEINIGLPLVLAPHTKLATTRWRHTTTLAEEYGVVDTDEMDLYAAMDWLHERQEFIEKKLAARHLSEGALERGGDGRRHGFRAGSRQRGRYRDRGKVDGRQRRNRQQPK